MLLNKQAYTRYDIKKYKTFASTTNEIINHRTGISTVSNRKRVRSWCNVLREWSDICTYRHIQSRQCWVLQASSVKRSRWWHLATSTWTSTWQIHCHASCLHAIASESDVPSSRRRPRTCCRPSSPPTVTLTTLGCCSWHNSLDTTTSLPYRLHSGWRRLLLIEITYERYFFRIKLIILRNLRCVIFEEA